MSLICSLYLVLKRKSESEIAMCDRMQMYNIMSCLFCSQIAFFSFFFFP
jgi:hypothetical protein